MGLLRLLLAVSVVLVHTSGCFGLRPLGAAEAVQTFYIISGFYMAMILTEKYRGQGSYRLFLTNQQTLLRVNGPALTKVLGDVPPNHHYYGTRCAWLGSGSRWRPRS